VYRGYGQFRVTQELLEEAAKALGVLTILGLAATSGNLLERRQVCTGGEVSACPSEDYRPHCRIHRRPGERVLERIHH
jgi:hypothetical protein